MKTRFRTLWQTRAPRERLMVAVLVAVAAVILYGWLVYAAGLARPQLRDGVTALRAQALLLDEQALEYGRLRSAPAPAASGADLRTLVQARIGAAGLTAALVRIDAPAENKVTVTFGSLPFADWLALTAGLQAQQVRLEACRIEALSTPGLVSVSATLVRASP